MVLTPLLCPTQQSEHLDFLALKAHLWGVGTSFPSPFVPSPVPSRHRIRPSPPFIRGLTPTTSATPPRTRPSSHVQEGIEPRPYLDAKGGMRTARLGGLELDRRRACCSEMGPPRGLLSSTRSRFIPSPSLLLHRLRLASIRACFRPLHHHFRSDDVRRGLNSQVRVLFAGGRFGVGDIGRPVG